PSGCGPRYRRPWNKRRQSSHLLSGQPRQERRTDAWAQLSGEVMTFEMFGAGCFGAVIGFVAWHVFRAGEASLDVKQLGAFIGALLGAVVLSAFPAAPHTIRGLFVFESSSASGIQRGPRPIKIY